MRIVARLFAFNGMVIVLSATFKASPGFSVIEHKQAEVTLEASVRFASQSLPLVS